MNRTAKTACRWHGILIAFGKMYGGDSNFQGYEGVLMRLSVSFNAAEVDLIRVATYRHFNVAKVTLDARHVQARENSFVSWTVFVGRNSMAIKCLPSTWPGKVSRLLHAKPVCPMCTSIEFRRSPARAVDGMLKLVNLIPLQCTNCWRYFYWVRDDRVFTSQANRADWMN